MKLSHFDKQFHRECFRSLSLRLRYPWIEKQKRKVVDIFFCLLVSTTHIYHSRKQIYSKAVFGPTTRLGLFSTHEKEKESYRFRLHSTP